MAKWWRKRNMIDENGEERVVIGKPNVSFRKIINLQHEGLPIGKNVQQYAVLVMDVPNLSSQRATYAPLSTLTFCVQ